ncbi:MAG TPA: HAMP domain-containing sensor histidine kinase [Solirubrobacteraceae bacterium]|nr:HAMP domain-containing sensor histidine kinase [Solirubrobacteraceae bacterium]
MRSAGLQLRVAVAAAVAIVVAVAALGIAVLARLDSQLYDSLDDSLRVRATEVARLSASTPGLLTRPGTLEGRLGGSPLLVQVIDPRGRIVARSSALGSRVLPDAPVVINALDRREAGYGSTRLGTDPVRVYAAPLGELGQGEAAGGAVVVAGATAEIEDTLDDTRRFVLLASLAAVVLAAALVTILARRALRPLRRLSQGARAIERTGDASQRLPDPHARDEVGTLAETLNGMLASLERAREAEQRFVGDASHELRTPLTALRGNLAYIAKHGADAEVMADVEADAARLGVLLDDLLALAREDAAAPARGEPVDLAQVAREQDGVEVTADGPVIVEGERPALERAVGNLVRNARRHGQGRIDVTVERTDGRARLSVQDEGPGLSPEQAEHAFERFWRDQRTTAPGSGLGLAIVKAIAERHQGTVTVEGSRFTIDLPASQGSLKPRP